MFEQAKELHASDKTFVAIAVLFHVSNRYLDLTPVVARLAADAAAPVRHLLVPPVGASDMSLRCLPCPRCGWP